MPADRRDPVSALTTLYDEAAIAERIGQLSAEIAQKLPREFMIVGLLKGSFVFMADLTRALGRAGAAPSVEFLRLSSYGLGKESSGTMHLISDIPGDISGRDVLLVDDILDTGRSLAYARALVEQRDAARIWTCVLLDKPSRREVAVAVDFVGFSVGDVFVAGYGIDYAEKYRHLADIVAVE